MLKLLLLEHLIACTTLLTLGFLCILSTHDIIFMVLGPACVLLGSQSVFIVSFYDWQDTAISKYERLATALLLICTATSIWGIYMYIEYVFKVTDKNIAALYTAICFILFRILFWFITKPLKKKLQECI